MNAFELTILLNVVLFTLFAVLSLWIAIRVAKRQKVLTAIIPITFGLIFTSITTHHNLEGYPAIEKPAKPFEFLYYIANEPSNILLFVRELEAKTFRLYQIPYSRETHRKLEAAQKQRQEGAQIRGSVPGKEAEGKGTAGNIYGDNDIELQIYNFGQVEGPTK